MQEEAITFGGPIPFLLFIIIRLLEGVDVDEQDNLYRCSIEHVSGSYAGHGTSLTQLATWKV